MKLTPAFLGPRTLSLTLVCLMVAACGSAPPAQPAPDAAKTSAPPPPPVVAPAPPPVPAHLDPQHAIYRERSIYFEFNDAGVRPEALKLVELHGRYLAAHPALKVAVEGHTDERGNTRYNLALGKRRADAVKTALLAFGVDAAQVETTSVIDKGTQKPAAGEEEDARARSRRVDIVYLSDR